MSDLVGVVKLYNRHRVFHQEGSFRIETEDRKGKLYTTHVPSGMVDMVDRSFAGGIVTVKDVAPLAGRLAAEHGLPCSYGHKRQYLAQDILVVLVALKRATHEKIGRGWEYSVSG